jgi:hypothetical protein
MLKTPVTRSKPVLVCLDPMPVVGIHNYCHQSNLPASVHAADSVPNKSPAAVIAQKAKENILIVD